VARNMPDTRDIVWLNFTPHATRQRPALVLSPVAYGSKTSLMLCNADQELPL